MPTKQLCDSAHAAVADVPDGASLLVHSFGPPQAWPTDCLLALAERGVRVTGSIAPRRIPSCMRSPGGVRAARAKRSCSSAVSAAAMAPKCARSSGVAILVT